MEVMLAALMGLLVGGASTRSHPSVNPGPAFGALVGLVAGLLGRAWFEPSLTPMLADQELAGAVAGATIGGLLLAPLMGIAVKALRRLWVARSASRPASDD